MLLFHYHCAALILLLLSLSLPNAATAFSVNNVRSRIPEEVVQRQLDALRKADVAKAYEYNSPNNQEVVGDWENFAAMLSDKSFRPILCHSESSVLMTVSHDEDDEYVCCLVRIVPGKDPLPQNIHSLINKFRGEDENKNNEDEEEEEDEETEERDYLMSTKTPSCVLYWWEVSQQYDEESKSYHYLVDSVLPDAEDIESDFMETTLFSIDDEDFGEDDEDDDGSFFFLDFGLY
jgi:hypothetical protein